MTIFRYVVEAVLCITWLAGLLVRIIFREEYKTPQGRHELRQSRALWPLSMVGSTMTLIVMLGWGQDADPIMRTGGVLLEGFYLYGTFCGVNWKIAYTDTEFIYRTAFRGLRKYSFEEVVSVKYMGETGKNRANADESFVLVMPDCKILVSAAQKPGDFLKKALRKQKRYM